MSTPAILALADGSLFYGTAIGADGETSGEVVFNTAMTGYQEILTDPSYAKQIVTLTYPHIGNTGVNPEDDESELEGSWQSGAETLCDWASLTEDGESECTVTITPEIEDITFLVRDTKGSVGSTGVIINIQNSWHSPCHTVC